MSVRANGDGSETILEDRTGSEALRLCLRSLEQGWAIGCDGMSAVGFESPPKQSAWPVQGAVPPGLAPVSGQEFRREVEVRLKARLQIAIAWQDDAFQFPKPTSAQLGDCTLLGMLPGTIEMRFMAQQRDLVLIPRSGLAAVCGQAGLHARQGTFLLLPAGIPHRIAFQDAEVLVASLDPSRLARTALELGITAANAPNANAGAGQVCVGQGLAGEVDVAAIVGNQLALAGLVPATLAPALRLDTLLYRLIARGLLDTRSAIPGELPDDGIAARICRHVLDNLEHPFAMEDLAELCGQSVRNVQIHFQRSLGVSPMQWIHHQKFLATRRALELAGPSDTVTSIALQYFSHLGSFAARYRSIFGELPSETIRRSPRRPAGQDSASRQEPAIGRRLAG